MKHYLLTADQSKAYSGLTDLFVITAADLTEATDNTAQTLTLDALAPGDVVFNDTVVEVITALAPVPSANAVVTCGVGITGTVEAFLAYSNLINSTALPAGTTYVSGEAKAAYANATTSAVSLLATIGCTDADGDLATITSGEFRIWMRILRAAKRQAVAA